MSILLACVEDFKADFPIKQVLLVVDGSITDQPIEQFVSLKINQPFFDETNVNAVLDAKVEVVVNDKERIRLDDKFKNGEYYFPIGFKPQANTNYRLEIITKEGKKYISSDEKMTPSPKIENLRVEFENDGISKGNDFFDPTHAIYLDTKDIAGVTNNYFWTWRAWEKQPICLTCKRGFYRLNTRTRQWECYVPKEPPPYDSDYPCGVPCWEIFYNGKLNVLNDIYFDGKNIKDRLVAKVPYVQYTPVLVEITQQSVSEAGFRYLRLLVQQGQNTGTIADTPPAALVGNIRNVDNPRELVGGIFMVSGTDSRLLWIDRKDVPFGSKLPKGLLEREHNFEDVQRQIIGMPIPPCLNSKARTNIKPIGWRD